jgi:hypothetical protein
MQKPNPMKGISRIDQPEKRTHGYFVRLARAGKTHSAFFPDKTHGGQEQALAAAQEHYQKLLAKFGPVGKSLNRQWMDEAINTKPHARPKRPDYLDAARMKWVQCHGFRCLAFLDATGQWVNFYTGKALTGPLKLIH